MCLTPELKFGLLELYSHNTFLLFIFILYVFLTMSVSVQSVQGTSSLATSQHEMPVQTTPENGGDSSCSHIHSLQQDFSIPTEIDVPALTTASKILAIIDRYRLQKSPASLTKADEGALKFLAVIYTHVKKSSAIPLCLPAFPFKSPNSVSKVLGKLPDRAEDLALAHLHGLCCAIQDTYPPGAKLTIISDGLVYNGMLCSKTTGR